MSSINAYPGDPVDPLDALHRVLHAVRSGAARTRPELGRQLGLGRTAVNQRVSHLLAAGLVEECSFAPSTGGRPARALRFRATAAQLLVADLGATSLSAASADLDGRLSCVHKEQFDVAAGPERMLERVERLFDTILTHQPPSAPPVWGVGIGLPGPVRFAEGRPVAPPIMPGWDGYPVRDRLAERYQVPAWVDNDVNIMALGETRFGAARGHQDAVVVKIGSGIGAGLVSQGRLHRGSQGAAGDIGHIAVTGDRQVQCRCGNPDCLEAVAGGAALANQANDAARTGASPLLAGWLADRAGSTTAAGRAGRPTAGRVDSLTAADLVDARAHADRAAAELLARSSHRVGQVLATLVNFFNPSIVVVGGGVVAGAGEPYLATIRETVYSRSLPLATRRLQIVCSTLGGVAGLRGAAAMVADELFAREQLRHWIDRGSPALTSDRTLVEQLL